MCSDGSLCAILLGVLCHFACAPLLCAMVVSLNDEIVFVVIVANAIVVVVVVMVVVVVVLFAVVAMVIDVIVIEVVDCGK